MARLPQLTAEDIALRRPVWIAMSDLFLDTDVRLYYAKTAQAMAESPFSVDELNLIFTLEVSPLLAINLFTVAGEWAAFDEEWLVSRITARLASAARRQPAEQVHSSLGGAVDTAPILREFRQRTSRIPWFDSLASDDWEAVVLLTEGLRRLDPAERPRRIALWNQLSKLFLDHEPPRPPQLDGWSAAELESAWREEMWPAYGKTVDAYRKHNRAGYPTKAEIQRGANIWRTSG